VDVYDRDSFGKAAGILETLTLGGFLVDPATIDYATLGHKVKGSAILFAPGEEAMAEVVAQYVRGLELVPAPKAVMNGAEVAVVIGANYEPPSLEGSPPQTSADCPA
jgi:hypothetical protein